jgi:alanine racemase
MTERKTNRDLWIKQISIIKTLMERIELLEKHNQKIEASLTRLIAALRYNNGWNRCGIDGEQYNEVLKKLMKD